MIDAAIFGGGPAATAAAIALARRGRRVALFTRRANPAFLVGETLPPAADSLLARLNANPYFDRCPKMESLGILSSWGCTEPEVQDFMLQPGGRGWHVDRKALNQALLDAAADSGARIEWIAGRARVSRAGAGEWLTGAGPARFLIDATGRASAYAFPGSPSHRVADMAISLVRHWRSGSGESTYSGWTLIEACEEGWCYSAPLPGGNIVASFQTGPDWPRTRPAGWDAAWSVLLTQLPETSRRLGGAQPVSDWRLFSTVSKTRSAFSGPGWFVAGDAANACDPLSGSGVVRALRDGMRVAWAVDCALDGDAAPAGAYDEMQRAEWRAYLTESRWYYSLESRWQEAPFWRTRAAES